MREKVDCVREWEGKLCACMYMYMYVEVCKYNVHVGNSVRVIICAFS